MRAYDDSCHLALNDLESECIVVDVRLLGSGHPREAGARNVVICAFVTCNAGCLKFLLADLRLVHEVLVVGDDDDVERVVPGAAVDLLYHLVLRHHPLHRLRLAGLCGALKALDLAVAGTHVVVLNVCSACSSGRR